MKAEILKMLKEAHGFLSGQDICDILKVSRTAVWKIIGQLEKEGYQIKAVRNKGYCLMKTADVITKAELESTISTEIFGRQVEYYERTDSTNLRAKHLAEEGALHGTLVTADYQSAGRGRRGRGWVSEPGQGIWMSLILRPDMVPSSAPMLTLIAALAVRTGIEKITRVETSIKWPNDLVVNGKKLCGILTEMSAELDAIHYVVVGMGINVHQAFFPEELEEKATSLAQCTGNVYSRSLLISSVMEAFESYYHRFVYTGGLSTFVEEYNHFLAGKNQVIQVLCPGDTYEAVELGIDETGNLLVQLSDGTVKNVVSGEVSIRSVHGYI